MPRADVRHTAAARLAWAGVSLAAVAPGLAHAQVNVRVQEGPLPFTEQQLSDAVALRVQRGGAPSAASTVVVRALSEGQVRVTTNARTADVSVQGRQGPAAARVVALVVADLVAPGPAWTDSAPRSPAAWTVTPTFGLTVGPSIGPLVGPSLGISRHGSNGWEATGELGYAPSGPIQPRTPGAAEGGRLHQGIARLSMGRAWGPWGARLGLVARPHLLTFGEGTRGITFGASPSATARMPVAGVPLVLSAGADLVTQRTEFRHGAAQVAALPWWSLWMAIGVGLGTGVRS